jgi:PAS domain S-box-containing protein
VLLLVAEGRNRDLLAERLEDRHEVVVGDPDGEWGSFDLCVVDATTYRRVEAEIAARKREAQAYLPVLLLVPEGNRASEAEWLAKELGRTVDDVLVVPAPALEFGARVGALLRTRRQSLTLALYRRAMDEASVGITITDPTRPDNPIVYVNDRFLELTGYDREAVVGRNCRFLQGPDTGDAPVRAMREAVDAGEPETVELLNYRADGTPFWNRVTIAPVRNDDGTVGNYVGFQEDVTDRIDRERELDRERERFRALARSATDAIVVVDEEGTVVYANEAVERIFGHPPSAVEGEPLTTLMPDRLRDRHREGFGRYLASGERRVDREMLRFPGLHADGHEVPLEISFAAFEDADDRLFAGVIRDVTEREELEAELRGERDLLERVFDTSPVGITVIDADGDIVRANETAEEELGLTRSEILSRTYDAPEWEVFDADGDPIPPEELPFSRVMATGEPVEDYRHGIRVDGEVRWISINAAPLFGEGGAIEAVVASIEDVTDRVEREQELERYETIVQTTTEPVFVLDAEGRFARVNDAMVEESGYAREELLGTHVSAVTDEADVREAESLIAELLAGERDRATTEAAMETADGARKQYAISLAVLREDGAFDGTVVVAHDVTDLRAHQRRLSVLDRVLRHNLRNKMNIVVGHADELAAADDPAVAERAERILKPASDLLELSDSARQFESAVTGDGGEGDVVDVTDLVRDVVAETARDHPSVDVRPTLPGSAPARVHGTFELAVEELLENAIAHSDREEPTIAVSVEVGEDAVEVRVADDGPGLDEVDREALLRGGETELSHSQGIGLWLVRWSVESVDGSIDIAENEPRGTVVTVSLPRAGA